MVASHRSEQILRSWNRSRGGCLVWNDAAFNKGMTIAAQQPRMICKYVKHCYLFIIESQDQNWGAYSLYLSPVSFKKDVTTISDTSWNSQWWNLNFEISCIGFLFPYSRGPHITCSNPDIAAGLGSTFRRASTSLGCHPAVWGRSHQEAPSGRQLGKPQGGSFCGSGRWNNQQSECFWKEKKAPGLTISQILLIWICSFPVSIFPLFKDCNASMLAS